MAVKEISFSGLSRRPSTGFIWQKYLDKLVGVRVGEELLRTQGLSALPSQEAGCCSPQPFASEHCGGCGECGLRWELGLT